MSRRVPLAAVFAFAASLPLRADEPPAPYAGWAHRSAGAEEALRRPPPEPQPVPVRDLVSLKRTLGDLIGTGDWLRAAQILDGRTRGAALRAVLVRGDRGILVGAREAARRQLRGLPTDARAALLRDRAPVLDPLLRTSDDAALRELVLQAPTSQHAARALTRLGERAFEAGRLEDAALLWRRAFAESPSPPGPLTGRLLKLRALPSHHARADANVGPPAPGSGDVGALQLLWARATTPAAARALASEGVVAGPARVYFVDGGAVVAVSRADGRLEWTAPGAEPGAPLALAAGALVHGGSEGLVGLDPRTGARRWSLPLQGWRAKGSEPQPSDRCVALTAADGGVAALLTLDRVRRLTQITPGGQVAWTTTLWESEAPQLVPPPIALTETSPPLGDPCANPEDAEGTCPSRGSFQPGVHPEKERRALRPLYLAPAYRTLVNDGQLAGVGGRVFLTADGLVAAVDASTGEVIWLRDRLTGLGVGGDGTIRVALRAGAYAVEAVTASGLLVRLDPLDGSTLKGPSGNETDSVFRLASHPMVLCWRGLEGARLTVGPAAHPLGALNTPPLWPGASLRGVLALPTQEGLRLLSTHREAPARVVPWPLGPGQVAAASGLLLVISPQGIAAFAAGPTASTPPLPSTLSVAHLADPAWQVRLAARRELAGRLPTEAKTLRPLLEAAAGRDDPELSTSARALLAALERSERWSGLAPGVTVAAVDATLQDASRVAALAKLLAPADPAKRSAALVSEFIEHDDRRSQLAVLELLVHSERRMRGRLVAFVRTSPSPGARRAAADLLVSVAKAGGPLRPLQVLVRHELKTPPGGAVIAALAAAGDVTLWEQVAGAPPEVPLPALQQWFQQNPFHDPEPAALLRDLRPFVERLVPR